MHFLLRKRRFYITFLLLVAIGLAGAAGQRFLFIEDLERLALDIRMKGIGLNAPAPEIVIVQGGEKSLQQLGAWPWPRTTHAALLGKIASARLVMLDILFPEPSTPQADKALSDTAAVMGNIVAAMHIATDALKKEGMPLPPFQAFSEAVLGVGMTNVEEDIDGLIRYHTPVRIIDQRAYPSLPLAAAMALSGDTPSVEEADNGFQLTIGSRVMPLGLAGNLWMDLSRPEYPTYEYADVLSGKIPPETFRDKVVVVGISASGVEDFHVVPTGLKKRVLTGTQYNAMAFETILAGRIPSRISPIETTCIALGLALLGALVSWPRNPLIGVAGFLLIGISYISLNLWLFAKSLLWIDLAAPLLALTTGHICAAFVRYAILHQDWTLKTYSLSSLHSLESMSRDHASLGDFLSDVWPQFKAGSGVDLIVPQAALEDISSDVRQTVASGLEKNNGQPQVVILRSGTHGYDQKMVLPVPAGDGSGTFKYTVLGWKGRLADDTSRTLAVTILSAAWFYRTLSRGRERRNLLTETIRAIFKALDFRDPITGGHSDRVASLALDILRELNVDDETREDIHLGALIHDIGKIGIPDSVLGKPDKLTGDEFGLILKHPAIGDEIMNTVPLPELSKRTMAEHHERYDGSGYPKGIAGDHVSLGARIVAVADVFDALCSDRPYRKGLSVEKVCDYIAAGSGRKYDPIIVEVLLRLKAPDGWSPGKPPPEARLEKHDEN